MIEAIALLRRIADECECRARTADHGGAVIQAETMDIAAKWHWLAGEATKLCERSKELNGADAACAQCLERCLD
jgi:hypothetical protein